MALRLKWLVLESHHPVVSCMNAGRHLQLNHPGSRNGERQLTAKSRNTVDGLDLAEQHDRSQAAGGFPFRCTPQEDKEAYFLRHVLLRFRFRPSGHEHN